MKRLQTGVIAPFLAFALLAALFMGPVIAHEAGVDQSKHAYGRK